MDTPNHANTPAERKTVIINYSEAVGRANAILSNHDPFLPHIENIGRALLIIALHESGLSPDYRPYEELWQTRPEQSSFVCGDILPFTISANDHQAVRLEISPTTCHSVPEVIDTLRHIVLEANKRPAVQLENGYWRINGQTYPPLAESQVYVVQALLNANGMRLSENEMIVRSGMASARRILTEIAQLPGWSEIIDLPERPRQGYGFKS